VPPPEDPFPQKSQWTAQIPWERAQQEAQDALVAYLATNTENPGGHEARGTAYLGSLLDAAQIQYTTHAFAPGRENLVARLPAANPTRGPLCLLSHIDVATLEREHWEVDPYGGVVDEEGYIWGRGALDMKSVGMAELMGMVWLKRLGVPLQRDVILLAVGDEEVDNLGVKYLAEHHWADVGCEHILNEGGLGVKGALVDDLTTFAVSFTEKGALWVKMWAHGDPGHGSTPLPDSAPARLQEALNALAKRKAKPQWHPQVFELLHAIGTKAGGVTGAVLRSESLTKSLAKGQLMDHPLSRAVLTNTVNVTGFGGAEEPNVVPSAVYAQLDVRLLPGTQPEEMLDELKALVADVEGIDFEVMHALPAVESPVTDPVYSTITGTLERNPPYVPRVQRRKLPEN